MHPQRGEKANFTTRSSESAYLFMEHFIAKLKENGRAAIFRHTTTLGMRETTCRRHLLRRRIESETLQNGSTVRRKHAEGFGVSRSKIEHDDLASIARAKGVSLREAAASAEG